MGQGWGRIISEIIEFPNIIVIIVHEVDRALLCSDQIVSTDSFFPAEIVSVSYSTSYMVATTLHCAWRNSDLRSLLFEEMVILSQ